MDDAILKNCIKKYDSFRNKLKLIINSSNSMLIETIYLVDKSWREEFKKIIEKFNNFQNKNEISKLKKIINNFNNFIKKEPPFIKDISEIISYIKNNKKYSLINRDLMKIIINKDILNKFNYFKCYGQNNKLIIESQIIEENRALLLVDPFKSKKNINNEFIIIINNNNKENLFKQILIQENLDMDIMINKNLIFPFKLYINKIHILKIFIYLYYF